MDSMINTIVKSNLKKNKLKNTMIIVTISLTTCLLISVSLVIYNMMQNQKISTTKIYGNSHGSYMELTPNQVEKLRKHEGIEIVGESSVEVGRNEFNGSNLGLFYMDEKTTELSSMELIEGRVPMKYNEIALDKTIISKLGYHANLGNKINLGYYDMNGNFVKNEFVLTGILPKDVKGDINNSHNAIISKDLIKKENYSNKMRAIVRVKNEEKLSASSIKSKIEEIGNDIGIKKSNISFNDTYLLVMKPDPIIILGGILISLIIIFSSALVIYNIFYISIVIKIKEFGKIKAIGATNKQLRSIIFREGTTLSIISIPIGIVLGCIISNIIINKLIVSMDQVGIDFKMSIKASLIILSTILTLITTYISLLKPMKIVSKIAPIEAMVYISNDNIRDEIRKGYENISVSKLSKANLIRNKKRTVITIVSLCLSGVIIVATSNIIGSVDFEHMERKRMVGDFQIRLKYLGFDYENEKKSFLESNPLNDELINQIKLLDGVKRVDIIREVDIKTPNIGEYKNESPEVEELDLNMSGYDDGILEGLKPFIVSGKLDINKLKSGEEIILDSPTSSGLGLVVGDSVTLIYTENNKRVEKNVKIQAIVETSYGGSFITSSEIIQNTTVNNYNALIGISAESSKKKDVDKVLSSMFSNYNNLYFESFEDKVESSQTLFFAIGSMIYMLIGVVGLISLLNLGNTIITNIIARKREIGMLQAIGMSDYQVLTMLKYEGAFYTITSIIISGIVGSLMGYIGYKVMYLNGASYMNYKLPLVTIIIISLLVSMVQLGISKFINVYFKKDSLIDRIRYSE